MRTSWLVAPLTFLLHHGLLLGAEAFSASGHRTVSFRKKPPASTSRHPCTRVLKNHADDDALRTEEEERWTMTEDWALLDQLTRFTVGSGDQVSTFWTQLAIATPELSYKTPHQLYQRCEQMVEDSEQRARAIPVFGPAPPLLIQWQMDLTTTRDNRAVGQLEDGRTIWLHYHCVGRLPGDPLADTSSSVIALVPGGYVEAVGGRIYELGEARLMSQTSSMSILSSYQRGCASNPSSSSPISEEPPSSMAWRIPASVGTVSALLASTVLSACIGYGAGLGIVADGSGPQYQSTSMATKPAHTDEPSFAERKARTEYKVLREQRLLQKITSQLEQDRAELQGFQQLEYQSASQGLLP